MREQKTPKPRKGRPPKNRRESLQPSENSNLKSEVALVSSELDTVEKEVKDEADPSPRLSGSFVSPDKSDESDTVSVNGEGNCSSNTSLIECSGFKGPSSQSSVSQEASNYTYEIGTRLEAKDLGNEIWYAAKVVEVDWEEEEILIHFEKWSQRYDEWIPMDSSRLRPAKAKPEPPKKSFKDFKVGEKVMATWSDSRKYPAQIKAVLPNDRYEVLFYDGFTKIIRAGRISKHDGETCVENEFQSPRMKEEFKAAVSESLLNESLSPDNATDSIGTKEDRRARKRKLNFAELFHFKKRSRFDKDGLTGKSLFSAKRGRKKHVLVGLEKSVEANEPDKLHVSEHAISAGAKAVSGSTPLDIKKKRGRRRVECDSEGSAEKLVKRPRTHFSEAKEKDAEYKPPGRKLKLKTEDSHAVNKSVAQVKGEDESFKKEDSNSSPSVEPKKPVEEEWRPEGEIAYVVGGADGPRQSIIMADDRVPEGWVKHSIQRMSGNSAGKWDVFFLSPHGKKFRTKHDLKNFYEEKGEKFPVHAFDFSLRQKKGPRAAGGDSSSSGVVLPAEPGRKSKQGPGRRRSSGVSEGEFPEQGLVQKRVKTLLPKVRLPQNEEGAGDSVAQSSGTPPPYLSIGGDNSPISRPVEDAAGGVFVGGLRVQRENDAFKCPKDGCNKNFRKENLLQMHIKHYHPEYNKFMGSTPNVADLAYARTIGEPVEDIVPKSRYSVKSPAFLEKINRFEATRKVKVGEVVLSDKKKTPPFKEKVTTISPTVKRSLKEYLEDDKYHTGADGMSERAVMVDLRSGEASDHVIPSVPSSMGASEATPVGDSEQAVGRAFSPTVRVQPGDLDERTKTKMPILEKVDMLNEGTEIGVKREVESPHVLPPTLVSQGKSVRTIRKKHLTDFHMEPVHRKRKPALKITEVLDKSDNTEEGLLTEGDDSGGARTPSVYHFSKKKNPTVHLEKLNVMADSNGTEGQGESASEGGAGATKLEHLRKEEIINCTCEVTEEDGLMIQCDLCLCWQHGFCNNIEKEEDVPEKYVCQICLNPNKERLSRKYIHNQDWLKEGKLPSLSFRSKDTNKIAQREKILKRSHDLTAELVKLEQMLHNINVKIDIAGNGEHPKLILWSKTWNQKVNNNCSQIKEEVKEEIKPVQAPVAAASDNLKVEPDSNVTIVEEQEVNLGTEVEIEAEEEVISSEEKTELEENAPAVEKSDTCDSESNTVEVKEEDKDSSENCNPPISEEVVHLSENLNVPGELKLEHSDDSTSVEQHKEVEGVDPVAQESDAVVVDVPKLTVDAIEEEKVKDLEEKPEQGDKGGPEDDVVEEEEICEGEVSKNEEEADTTETGDEDGSLLQQALTSDPNQADGDIQLPLCQSELMQLATSIVGNLEDADVDQLPTKCVSAPIPEAPIDFMVCQKTLIEHIEQYQQKIDERLTSLEAQLAELESQEPDLDDESPLYCPRTKQTIQMLLRDLGAMRQIGNISSD